MTHEQLIEHLVKDCEQPRDVVKDFLLSLADYVGAALGRGERVALPGVCRLVPRLGFSNGDPVMYVTSHVDDEIRGPLEALARSIKAAGAVPPDVETPLRQWLHKGMGWPMEGKKQSRVEGRSARGGQGSRAKRRRGKQ